MEVKKVEKIYLWRDGFIAVHFDDTLKGTMKYSNELEEFIKKFWTSAHRLDPKNDTEISVCELDFSLVSGIPQLVAVIKERNSWREPTGSITVLEEKIKQIIPNPDGEVKKVAEITLKHKQITVNDAWHMELAEIFMISPKVKRIYVQYEKVENDRVVKEDEVEFRLSS